MPRAGLSLPRQRTGRVARERVKVKFQRPETAQRLDILPCLCTMCPWQTAFVQNAALTERRYFRPPATAHEYASVCAKIICEEKNVGEVRSLIYWLVLQCVTQQHYVMQCPS